MHNKGLVHMRMCTRIAEDGMSPGETIRKQDVLLSSSTAAERQLPLRP